MKGGGRATSSGEYIVQLGVMSQEQSVEPVSSEEAGMQEEGAVKGVKTQGRVRLTNGS